jgi:hypothetical protein
MNRPVGTIPPGAVTQVVAPRHSILTWTDETLSTPCLALCSCGWHATSMTPLLRQWNVDGHAKDVAP